MFSWGIFNYTRRDLLFWHEFPIILWVTWHSAKETINTFRTIIMREYYKSLSDDTYYLNSQARDSNPKFDLKITEKWVECKIRVLVHFYKLQETNNILMTALLDEHKKWTITLVKHKDYDWIE